MSLSMTDQELWDTLVMLGWSGDRAADATVPEQGTHQPIDALSWLLHRSFRKQHPRRWRQLVAGLLDAGADPNGFYERCPTLTRVAMTGDDDTVALMVQAGADVHRIHGDLRWTALHYLVYRFPAMTHLLVTLGANVVAVDLHGNTPLHILVESSAREVEDRLIGGRFLLAHGANPNSRNAAGLSVHDLVDGLDLSLKMKWQAVLLGAQWREKGEQDNWPVHRKGRL